MQYRDATCDYVHYGLASSIYFTLYYKTAAMSVCLCKVHWNNSTCSWLVGIPTYDELVDPSTTYCYSRDEMHCMNLKKGTATQNTAHKTKK